MLNFLTQISKKHNDQAIALLTWKFAVLAMNFFKRNFKVLLFTLVQDLNLSVVVWRQ